jgi:hypothetical protein
MATEGLEQGLTTVAASADLSAHQFKLVTFDGSAELALAGAGVDCNVLIDKPAAAGVSGTILLSGIGKVIAGGTISAGDALASNASGLAVTATSTDYIFGRALEDAVLNDVFRFQATAIAFEPGT